MSRENVETVRRFFEALAAATDGADENPDIWERLTSDDVVYVEDPKWPGSDTYKGRPAVKACWEAYGEALGVGTTISLREIHDADDQVVAVVTVAGNTQESNVPYEHTWGYVCEADANQVTYFRAHLDPTEARDAVGLSD